MCSSDLLIFSLLYSKEEQNQTTRGATTEIITEPKKKPSGAPKKSLRPKGRPQIQNANEIKTAIDERKAFVIRTAISVGFVILIFSFVLSRYFIKPIQNLVGYTIRIKEKSQVKPGIENLKKRNDELGLLSNSLEDMTNELQNRVTHAENFSTDLVHEIRNPLASLKSASEILQDTNGKEATP